MAIFPFGLWIVHNHSQLTKRKAFSILNQSAISSKQREQDTWKHLNKFITGKHSLFSGMGGHKANKLVCECKVNSTVPHHTVHMLLALAVSATSDLEPHDYQTAFCSLCLNSPLSHWFDKVIICIWCYSRAKIQCLAIRKWWTWDFKNLHHQLFILQLLLLQHLYFIQDLSFSPFLQFSPTCHTVSSDSNRSSNSKTRWKVAMNTSKW